MDISDATRGRVMVKVMMDDAGLDWADVEKLRDDLVSLVRQRFPDSEGDIVMQELAAGSRNWRRVGEKIPVVE